MLCVAGSLSIPGEQESVLRLWFALFSLTPPACCRSSLLAGGKAPQCSAPRNVLPREEPQCNRNPMPFPQHFIRFMLQLPWDRFSQPSSLCLFATKVHRLWPAVVLSPLFSLLGEKRLERSRRVWAIHRVMAATRLMFAVCSSLQHRAHCFGLQLGFRGALLKSCSLAAFPHCSGVNWDLWVGWDCCP